MRAGTGVAAIEGAAVIRPLRPTDVDRLRTILVSTAVFSDEEIIVALELMESYLSRPDQEDYDIRVAETEEGIVAGYVCFGPTPLTRGTFDLYWIAVDPAAHQKGIGSSLQSIVETEVEKRGGRLIVAQTSSLPRYEKARNFYYRHRYDMVACIKDYYKEGDDLVMFGKYVPQSQEHR